VRRVRLSGATREAAESYRKAALFVSNMVGDGARALLFCSARRAEGTTTAVINVALELQDSYGLRPLVIELPRRRPVLARLMSLDREQTIDLALEGRTPLADCVQTTTAGLAVVPGGSRRSSDPLPRLASRLHQLVAEAEDLADVVLIDAPPVLVQADALIAATVVPHLVLVIEAGRTDYDTLDRVKRELAIESLAIAGTILVKHRRFTPRWIDWWLAR
jgi:Mrp family chromosome partitioning ATPase